MHEHFDTILDRSPLLKFFYEHAKVSAMQVMDTDGYILHVNEAFTTTFGFTAVDLAGKHIRVLFTEDDQKRLLPEMELAQVKQFGAAADKNYSLHQDGSCIWVTGESVLVKEHNGPAFIVKIMHNVHEQKLLEKVLKEAQEFSDSVVKSISDALVVIDTHAKILKANHAFYNFFNINAESVEGMYIFELADPFWASGELKQRLQYVLDTGMANEFELQWKSDPEATRHLSVKTRFLDGKLADKRILLVITDISDKVYAEQQRDDLIGFVIHELRNPLANISLCNELLEQSIADNDAGATAEYLDKLQKNTERLNSLIRELFDATKAGAGALQFNKEPFRLNALVEEAIEAVQLSNATHRISKTGETDVELYADRKRLHQVLTNFLVNAIKYSPDADRVEVKVSMESGYAIVAVTDYGEGIAPDKIPHIFSRYYRANKGGKAEGLGLGLYLSKQIIDAHNGRVWIESTPGVGTSFFFSIPA